MATLIWILGNVSGGHFNPSVTIAFFFIGKVNPLLTLFYIASQCTGALTGKKKIIKIILFIHLMISIIK